MSKFSKSFFQDNSGGTILILDPIDPPGWQYMTLEEYQRYEASAKKFAEDCPLCKMGVPHTKDKQQ
jgi:hypothetical protein